MEGLFLLKAGSGIMLTKGSRWIFLYFVRQTLSAGPIILWTTTSCVYYTQISLHRKGVLVIHHSDVFTRGGQRDPYRYVWYKLSFDAVLSRNGRCGLDGSPARVTRQQSRAR